ncbi:MAG: NADH-quinone oxidoreductase subunit K [Alkalilacustris sp.]
MSAPGPDLMYGLAGLGMFALGLYHAMTGTEALRRVLALKICAIGASFLLIVAAWRATPAGIDAVPHALVITGIVVMVSAMAVALALIRRIRALEDAQDAGQEAGADGVPTPPAGPAAPFRTAARTGGTTP